MIRGVQRPVHPILSIGARAPRGAREGPLYSVKQYFFFGKIKIKEWEVQRKHNTQQAKDVLFLLVSQGEFQGLKSPMLLWEAGPQGPLKTHSKSGP